MCRVGEARKTFGRSTVKVVIVLDGTYEKAHAERKPVDILAEQHAIPDRAGGQATQAQPFSRRAGSASGLFSLAASRQRGRRSFRKASCSKGSPSVRTRRIRFIGGLAACCGTC